MGKKDEFSEMMSLLFQQRPSLAEIDRQSVFEELFLIKKLIDSLPDRIYLKDRNSRFIVCNKSTANHVGLESADELIGKKDSDFYKKEFADRYFADEQRMMETGDPIVYKDEQNEDRSEGAKWTLTTKMPLRGNDGNIVGLIGIGRDITSLKESERYITEKYFSLQFNEDFNFRNIFHNLIENSTDNIYFKDNKGHYILVNKNHSDWLGAASPSDVIGKKDGAFFSAKRAEEIQQDEEKILSTEKPITYEEDRFDIDRTRHWVLTQKYPFYNSENKVVGVFGISRSISHYKKMETKLKKANQQKTQFFINLAHETKTPLTLIKNYMENYVAKFGQNEDLQIITNNFDKLLRDMTNYLDEEKLRRKQIFYNNTKLVDVSDLLESKTALFREMAEMNGLVLSFKVHEGVLLRIDPLAIDRVVNNLLDNAIKYTKRGGKIQVVLKPENEKILLEVSDSGIGMTELQKENIFKPYYQLSHERQNLQGIGMGLNIVKNILDSVDGQIKVESVPKRGSSFTIFFLKPVVGEGEVVERSVQTPFPFSQKPIVRDLREIDILPDKRNILIVEDNCEMLHFLQNSLKDRYNVFLAQSGEEALGKLKLIPVPDLIISDVMMGELDGHKFLSRLMESKQYKAIPFIFLTAKTTAEEKIRGLLEGAIDYIYKPFLLQEVITKVENIIQKKTEQTEKTINEMEMRISSLLRDKGPEEKQLKKFNDFRETCARYKITAREEEVLRLLLQGLNNKEIGFELEIKLITVEKHSQSIFRKMGVHSRVELINAF